MKKSLCAICFTLFTMTNTAIAKSPSELDHQSESDLRDHIIGKTLEGFYRSADVLTGTHAYTETYHSDGRLIYDEKGLKDQGKWWIESDQLCHNYDSDNSEIDHCFYIFKDEFCFYYFEAFPSEPGKRHFSGKWNNRGLIRGQGKTCELPFV